MSVSFLKKPLVEKGKCHEWETSDVGSTCDWCGSGGYILQKVTEFEKFCEKVTEPEFCEFLHMIMDGDINVNE